MRIARHGHTASALTNGKVLVAVGISSGSGFMNSAELYDPSTGMWSVTGLLDTHRYRRTASVLLNGTVLVAAGFYGSSYLATSDSYNPLMCIWILTRQTLIIDARSYHVASLLPDGPFVVTGGSDGTRSLYTVACLDIPSQD